MSSGLALYVVPFDTIDSPKQSDFHLTSLGCLAVFRPRTMQRETDGQIQSQPQVCMVIRNVLGSKKVQRRQQTAYHTLYRVSCNDSRH
jgi:hypothetical protein